MNKLIAGTLIAATAVSASGCAWNNSQTYTGWIPRSEWADNALGLTAGGILVGALMGSGIGAGVAALGQTPLITGVSVGAIAGGVLGGIGGATAAACADSQQGC